MSKASLRSTLGLVQHHLHHTLLAKASHKVIPDSRSSPPLDGKRFKITCIARGTDTGRRKNVIIFAIYYTYQVEAK